MTEGMLPEPGRHPFFFEIICLKAYQRKKPAIKTTVLQAEATGKSPAPNQAQMIPAARASMPAAVLPVALKMAGKVMTERVT